MNTELKIWIDQAESTWRKDLYDHAKNLFQSCSLPSHDHTHHLRVWNLSKLLLEELSTFSSGLNQSLVEGALIAAFFHDLGMATSTQEDHGHLSRMNCERWFLDSSRQLPERFDEILQAIELHDMKEEKIYKSFQPDTPPQILGILSVADDLEALGIIGIFRYAEIYLLRDIPMEELGKRILNNVQARFEKIKKGCRLCLNLLATYQEQYSELRHFYEAYELQLSLTARAGEEKDGPLGVINYIRKHGLDHTFLDQTADDVQDYFRKLDYELGQARL